MGKEGGTMREYKPYEPGQGYLLPPSLREWLPEGHLAYFIDEVVEELDLSQFYAAYEEKRKGYWG